MSPITAGIAAAAAAAAAAATSSYQQPDPHRCAPGRHMQRRMLSYRHVPRTPRPAPMKPAAPPVMLWWFDAAVKPTSPRVTHVCRRRRLRHPCQCACRGRCRQQLRPSCSQNLATHMSRGLCVIVTIPGVYLGCEGSWGATDPLTHDFPFIPVADLALVADCG